MIEVDGAIEQRHVRVPRLLGGMDGRMRRRNESCGLSRIELPFVWMIASRPWGLQRAGSARTRGTRRGRSTPSGGRHMRARLLQVDITCERVLSSVRYPGRVPPRCLWGVYT